MTPVRAGSRTARRALAAASTVVVAAVAAGCGGTPPATIGDTGVHRYVALGDGFAASSNAGRTDRAKGCLRSRSSYPAVLAKKLGIDEFVDVTCAFARTQAVQRSTEPARGDKGRVPAQLDAVTDDTDLVTITMGLMDRDIFRRLFDVCAAEPYEDGTPAAELLRQVPRMKIALRDAVRAVEDKAPGARVWVVGYPQLLPDEGDCGPMPDLDQEQMDLVNGLLAQVNAALEDVADGTGSHFLDVAGLADGHDVCADAPWVAGKDGKGKDGKGKVPRFHPLPPYGAAVAAALATRVDS